MNHLSQALGKGAFAKVVLGTSRKSKSLPIRAVKIIDVKALSKTDIDALDLEIKTMSQTCPTHAPRPARASET